MRTIDDYLTLAITRRGLASDRALSVAMELSFGMVSGWRTRRYWPSDDAMLKLAEFAAIDRGEALIDLNIWRTSSPEVRAEYVNLAQRVAA